MRKCHSTSGSPNYPPITLGQSLSLSSLFRDSLKCAFISWPNYPPRLHTLLSFLPSWCVLVPSCRVIWAAIVVANFWELLYLAWLEGGCSELWIHHSCLNNPLTLFSPFLPKDQLSHLREAGHAFLALEHCSIYSGKF